MYYLAFYSNEVRRFLPKILPFLKVKKEQALLLLKATSIIKPKASREVDKRLSAMYIKMKKLNHSRFLPV